MNLGYDFHLGIGDNGNVFQIMNYRDNNRTQMFMYDALNRIQQAWTNGPNWGETYGSPATNPGTPPSTPGIDAWGNLGNRSGVTGKTQTEALSAAATNQNRLTGFNYDAAGNMTLNGTTGYTYDAENHLTLTSGYAYFYDADGNRVKKCTSIAVFTCQSSPTGTLYWRGAGGDPYVESSLGGTNQEEYIFFNGKRIARRDVSGSVVHYYFSDHLGTHDLITDALGTMPPQKESDYFPYGGEIPISGSDPNHYKFTGKERDSESGLDNFGARHDASSLGRFMSADPVGGHSENPQTLNRYAYVGNNPLIFTDPTGLDFYLKCPTDQDNLKHGQTCHDGYEVDDKGNKVVVTSDSIRSGQNSAVVDEKGVEITAGGQTLTGEYFDNPASHSKDDNGKDVDHNPVDLKGTGKFGDFQFHIFGSDVKSGNLAYGTATFFGTQDQMINTLQKGGAFQYPFDGSKHSSHPGMLNFRFSTGSHPILRDEGASAHFVVEPKSTVPLAGSRADFHVDSHTGPTHLACYSLGAGCN